MVTLLVGVGAVPYNPSGYGLIRNALADPIRAALNFGTIRAGVTLSALEIAQVNQAAGLNAAVLIQTQGYYLQVLDPGATIRANRGTPVVNVWYADGQAVQQISMASIDLQ